MLKTSFGPFALTGNPKKTAPLKPEDNHRSLGRARQFLSLNKVLLDSIGTSVAIHFFQVQEKILHWILYYTFLKLKKS